MSAHMKMHRTNAVEVIILGKKPTHYRGPKTKLKNLVALLGKNNFKPVLVEKTESISWEILADERIKKYGKPGLALRGARLKESLTQEELGNKAGVSQYNISKMENGTRSIGKKMALRLGKVLRINYRVFL